MDNIDKLSLSHSNDLYPNDIVQDKLSFYLQ